MCLQWEEAEDVIGLCQDVFERLTVYKYKNMVFDLLYGFIRRLKMTNSSSILAYTETIQHLACVWRINSLGLDFDTSWLLIFIFLKAAFSFKIPVYKESCLGVDNQLFGCYIFGRELCKYLINLLFISIFFSHLYEFFI